MKLHTIRMAVKENILSNPLLVTPADYERFLIVDGKGWLCEDKGAVAGFSIVDEKDKNVWALFVHPDFEGRGIGKQLLETLLQWYFTHYKETIWLSTSPGTRAEHFYRAAGWHQTGILKNGEVRFEMSRQTKYTNAHNPISFFTMVLKMLFLAARYKHVNCSSIHQHAFPFFISRFIFFLFHLRPNFLPFYRHLYR